MVATPRQSLVILNNYQVLRSATTANASRWAAASQMVAGEKIMAQMPVVTIKLEASQERELMARFFEYVFEHAWVVQDALDAIRDGSYIQYVLAPEESRPTWRALDAAPAQVSESENQ